MAREEGQDDVREVLDLDEGEQVVCAWDDRQFAVRQQPVHLHRLLDGNELVAVAEQSRLLRVPSPPCACLHPACYGHSISGHGIHPCRRYPITCVLLPGPC